MGAIDTSPKINKPNDNTDPWLVVTLTKIDERQKTIKNDLGTVSKWVGEHDVRHRKIDGRLAIVAIGVPIGTAIIILAVSTLLGG
jgi:hypothetical protein